MIIEYCHSSNLIPISVLYDFWFLRNTRFRRYTPSIFCYLSLKFKVSSIFEQHESLIINVSYLVALECYHRNPLLLISSLYGFWLLGYKCFCRYTPYIGLRFFSNIESSHQYLNTKKVKIFLCFHIIIEYCHNNHFIQILGLYI